MPGAGCVVTSDSSAAVTPAACPAHLRQVFHSDLGLCVRVVRGRSATCNMDREMAPGLTRGPLTYIWTLEKEEGRQRNSNLLFH